jgi:hypothetical protein
LGAPIVFRRRQATRRLLTGAAIGLVLLLVGEAALVLLPERISLEVRGRNGRLTMDGSDRAVTVPDLGPAPHIVFEQPGPVDREYQIDGSDTTSRNDRDRPLFRSIQNTPWYRLFGWLRDEGSYSRWLDVKLIDLADGRVVADGREAVEASPLPAAFRLQAALRRPEAPAQIWLESGSDTKEAGLSVERDAHRAVWLLGTDDSEPTRWFFPQDPWPFAAELAQLIGRTAAAAAGLFALMAAIGLAWQRWRASRRGLATGPSLNGHRSEVLPPPLALGLMAVAVWFAAALWITIREYHQLPHIVDAQAYFFEARILETGRTWLQAPDMVQMLDGFQQVEWNGRWFSQYPPGAPVLYAIGDIVGLAWLVGPLATLALLAGTAITGLLLFDRPVALTTLGLLALSPFVLFQAGSFMSHPIAGGAVACALAAFAYGWRSKRRAAFLWVGALLGVAFNTREVAAVLYGVIFGAWLLVHRRWPAVVWIVGAAAPFVALYLLFNLSTTGDPLTLPRNLFNEYDRWGFGALGPTGQHTLAAGLVNTDENLTLLQFDLFGWPPLAAPALIAMPFLLGRAGRFDMLLAACAGAFVIVYVGYFYHGIALGPRYYFEAVPALALLAARGCQASVQTLRELGLYTRSAGAAVGVVLGLLCAWTVGFYLPHEIDRRMDYGALGNERRLVLPFVENTLSGPHITSVEPPALVLVPDEDVFKSISALNCPLLEDAHLVECPVLLVNTSVDEAPPLFDRFAGRSLWIIERVGDLVTLQRLRASI